MPLAGMAAGSSNALQALLERAFQQKQLEQQMALRQQESERQQQELMLRAEQQRTDQEYRTGQVKRQGEQDAIAAGERDVAAADRRQEQNQRGVTRMIGDFVQQRGTTPLNLGERQQIAGMAVGEGVMKPEQLLDDPGQPQRERIELEDLRSKHAKELEAIQGANSLRTATARQDGTRDQRTQRRIDQVTKGFDAQPTVKRVQVLSEAANFARSLNPNTANPQDDQALIYGFAKAMDPESVVREGEYATVQKYSQSWAQKFGFDVARIFSNTTFLTPQARQNMKDTILQRFQAARGSYDALRKSYGTKVAGMGGDEADLIDYGAGFPSVDQAPPPAATPSGGAVQKWGRDANGRPVRLK